VRRAFLFDVDGTLVKSGGAGSRSLDRAFAQIYGRPGAMRNVRPHGRTDFSICREAFARNLGRHEVDRIEIERVLDAYIPILEEEVARSPTYQVIPGVPTLLEELARRGDILGLATGNIERGARIKIGRGGLNHFFEFGGFGDDGEDRTLMVRAARERALARLSPAPPPEPVYVVGDTVRDVEAAHAAGCVAVAVATGWENEETLRESGPEFLLLSLEGAAERPPFA